MLWIMMMRFINLNSYNLIKKSLKLNVPKNDLYEIYLNFYHHISRM